MPSSIRPFMTPYFNTVYQGCTVRVYSIPDSNVHSRRHPISSTSIRYDSVINSLLLVRVVLCGAAAWRPGHCLTAVAQLAGGQLGAVLSRPDRQLFGADAACVCTYIASSCVDCTTSQIRHQRVRLTPTRRAGAAR